MIDKEILNKISNQTPCYVHFKELIKQNFTQLKEVFPGNILYSLKSNPAVDVINILKEMGSFFDASSRKEIAILLQQKVNPNLISFVGPGKTPDDIEYAISKGVAVIVAESIEEIKIINKKSKNVNTISSILIRVNLKSYINSMGRESRSLPSQFGIDEEQITQVLSSIQEYNNIQFDGIHTYVQSQILNPHDIVRNFKNTLALANDINPNMTTVNFGGGLGIPYFKKQEELNLSILKEGLKEFPFTLKNLCLESGRYILGPAGFFITKIIYQKKSRGINYLIVDGGLSNHLAATGFGQVIRKNFKISLLKKDIGLINNTKEVYTIAGPSCYSLDILGNNVELPIAKDGDYICIHNSGAYGATFSPQEFLGQKVASQFYF